MNKRHYEHTLPNIRGSLSNTYDKRGMDQKREEADMYLFRHGITREKDRAKTRWQKVEKNKAE